MTIEEFLANPEAIEVARLAIEDAVIELRDARVTVLGVGNGVVCREKDGTPSSCIRLPTWVAIEIGMKAVAEKYKTN